MTALPRVGGCADTARRGRAATRDSVTAARDGSFGKAVCMPRTPHLQERSPLTRAGHVPASWKRRPDPCRCRRVGIAGPQRSVRREVRHHREVPDLDRRGEKVVEMGKQRLQMRHGQMGNQISLAAPVLAEDETAGQVGWRALKEGRGRIARQDQRCNSRSHEDFRFGRTRVHIRRRSRFASSLT